MMNIIYLPHSGSERTGGKANKKGQELASNMKNSGKDAAIFRAERYLRALLY
jgi:hypothetical protein